MQTESETIQRRVHQFGSRIRTVDFTRRTGPAVVAHRTGDGMHTPSDFLIRTARRRDLETLGRLGALLVRTHYEFDTQRFLAPGAATEEGYAWFLGTQLHSRRAVVLVAERDGVVIGYVYAGLEPQSWKELREPAGFVHDVAVDPTAPPRRGGHRAREPGDGVARGSRRPQSHSLDGGGQPSGADALRSTRVQANDDRDDARAGRSIAR